ncbi:MAG: FAD binding domain-containing protein [Fretibacterium sp.]|nr:FAD binding domain-containing protein [Fretibacterium sp.]
MLPKFEIFTPATVNEASALARRYSAEARLLAGGTDVYVMMREGKMQAKYLIDIKGIPGLAGISVLEDGGLRIGAATTFSEIVSSEYVRRNYPSFLDGMGKIGSLQVRNVATIGGNICNAIPSADSVPILLCLDAQLEAQSERGKRLIPLAGFYRGFRSTALEEGEVVTALLVPSVLKGGCSAYYKFTRRRALDIALFGVSVALEMDGDVCRKARVAMATAAPMPVRVEAVEEYLTGKELTDEVLREAGMVARDAISPRSSVRSSGEYRKQLAKALLPRAARAALQRLQGK